MHKQNGYTATQLLLVIIYLVGIGGWVANIIKMIGMLNEPITGMFIIRAIGVLLPPLGAVLGFV